METYTAKKTLLIISAISPFPTDSGGATRILNTVKYLSTYFNVHFIFLKKTEYKLTKQETIFITKHTVSYYIFDLKENRTNSDFAGKYIPYWFSNWFDSELILGINKIVSTYHFDLIQIELTQLAYLIDYLPAKIPTALISYDVSTTSFFRRLKEVKNPKTILSHFVFCLEIFLYERHYLPKYDFVIAMSPTDNKSLTRLFSLKNVFTTPNGIEKIYPKTLQSSSTLKLGYIGSFNHPPNLHAFKFIINNIAPLLEKNNINYEFIMAGNNPPSTIDYLISSSPLKNKNSIKQIGFIKNLKNFYDHIDLLITPIFSGSGTRLKILESFSFSTPVISTSIGAEGINDIDPNFLMIANTAAEFYNLISTYHPNKTSQSLVDSASLKKYLWLNIFNNYNEFVQNNFLQKA